MLDAVAQTLEYWAAPGYHRQKPVLLPKLGPWQGMIDTILEDDKGSVQSSSNFRSSLLHSGRQSVSDQHYAIAPQNPAIPL